MADQTTFRVTCKAALFTPSKSEVLLADYHEDQFGLPGGHIERNETPDQAMARELKEETGLSNIQVQHYDFWLHHNGKLILGFTGLFLENRS